MTRGIGRLRISGVRVVQLRLAQAYIEHLLNLRGLLVVDFLVLASAHAGKENPVPAQDVGVKLVHVGSGRLHLLQHRAAQGHLQRVGLVVSAGVHQTQLRSVLGVIHIHTKGLVQVFPEGRVKRVEINTRLAVRKGINGFVDPIGRGERCGRRQS